MTNQTTICAPATAHGGAIGIIRVSGPEAIAITDTIFHGRQSLLDAKGYTIHYGKIMPPSTAGSNKDDSSSEPPIDDVLITIFRAPHSYTGEDSVEISCHGSAYIINAIISLLNEQGCSNAEPGEYTKRAFLNGKMDLSQAESVADLIASQNAAQHRVAMTQLRGGISTKLGELRDRLLHLTSLMELELDFSDHEELEFADRSELLTIAQQIEKEINRLKDSFKQGNAIKNGVPVAIIGAPNVGKSTLLNALLQDDKAIVSDIQGTTRDTIEDTITIGGTLFRFIDTAGIRHTDDKIERLGIERSIKAAERARIIILMRDQDNDYPTLSLRPDQTIVKIFNKSNSFQAINGTGLPELKQQLLKLSPLGDLDGAIITNQRHQQALSLAHEDITRAIMAMHQSLSGDLISEDLRLCITHLSDIVGGTITTDEVLSNIFSHFCIGK